MHYCRSRIYKWLVAYEGMDDLLDVLGDAPAVKSTFKDVKSSLDEIDNMLMKPATADADRSRPVSVASSSRWKPQDVKAAEAAFPSRSRSPSPSRPVSKQSNKSASAKSSHRPTTSEVAAMPPFPTIPEASVIRIEDELGYRKDIYQEDFVDFDDDITKTPRRIRPRTEYSVRPPTANSWISSTPSEPEEEEEVPLDTWVDEARLLYAFGKVRDAYTVEADSHRESMEKLEKLMNDLVLENEVNVVQRLQLKKEDAHTAVISSNVRDLQRDYSEFVDASENEVNRLYKEITSVREEIKSVQSQKMEAMYQVSRLDQELKFKNEEVQHFKALKSNMEMDSENTQKKSDVLQVGLKTQKQITETGESEFNETSWRLESNKKLVDTLIIRVDKAENDAKMWAHRYKMLGRDLSHIQKLMMNMSNSHTETQAVLYRDRALHYLKSVGGGDGIKEALPPVGVSANTGASLLADALKDPGIRKKVGGDGSRAKKIVGTTKDGKLFSLGGGGGRDRQGGRRGAQGDRPPRTPDIRMTKKKLQRYMANPIGNTGVSPSLDDVDVDKVVSKSAYALEDADDDFKRLLVAELENDAELKHPTSVGGRRAYSRMSEVSGVSGASGMTAVSAMSDGTALRYKTGLQRKRRAKAEEQRMKWMEQTLSINSNDFDDRRNVEYFKDTMSPPSLKGTTAPPRLKVDVPSKNSTFSDQQFGVEQVSLDSVGFELPF